MKKNELYNILQMDKKWYGKTQNIINKIEPYLKSTEMFFFPEYTVHGYQHVSNILQITENLIPDHSLDKLNSKDISFLILSIYLHDIAMFIKPDGLQKLFDIQIWRDKFNDFIKLASRFSDVELQKLYGEAKPFVYPNDLNDTLNLTLRDRLTYGEFIRRNHAVLAEYIILHSFPGNVDENLFVEFTEEERKIIGLICKSHSMDLRSAMNESSTQLIGKTNSYRPSNIPIIYLMVLLRMGDILDMGMDRSPHIIYNMQQFESILSKEEWDWNQTIDSNNFNWSTFATLYIQSEPQNTSQFIKVRKNLLWFQQELDLSWAALCDSYGNEFSLSIHRIASNIFEQPELFKKKFLTKEAKLSINSNLSKLLVEPLYHGKPFYGIRELLQNSVDACMIRKKIEFEKGNVRYEGKIDVIIDTKNNYIIVKDNGIGMDEDVIVNYYLTIGSSFRNSVFWNDIMSKDENTTRTGRFGVGFLATFLLGNEANITTRHIDDEQGYCFDIMLEKENIDADRIKEVEIGTIIKIKMKTSWNNLLRSTNGDTRYGFYNDYIPYSDYAINRIFKDNQLSEINWTEWYHYSNPSVHYWIDDKEIFPSFFYDAPSNLNNVAEKNNLSKWYYITMDGFNSVNYSFPSIRFGKSKYYYLGEDNLISNIIINGFLINNNISSYKRIWGIPNNVAICSIIDDKNLLNINLSRTEIEYNHPVFEKINIEIWKWQIASILKSKVAPVRKPYKHNQERQKYNDFTKNQDLPDGVLYLEDTFSFFHPYFIEKLNLSKVYILKEVRDRNVSIRNHIVGSEYPILMYNDQDYMTYLKGVIDFIGAKHEHLFILADCNTLKLNLKNSFIDLINELFNDVLDLWIPYDYEKRKKKFYKAFDMLKNYGIDE
ncbi:MAG: hypothetical protein HDQ98_11345 [Lachnospiraceae bacterium]|nr:hypothetical protein [Lachnospiraceae bacterium]